METPREQAEYAIRAMVKAGWPRDPGETARTYADRWLREEERPCPWSIGAPNFSERVAMVYLVEAAGACCQGTMAYMERGKILSGREMALRLVKLAQDELEHGVSEKQ